MIKTKRKRRTKAQIIADKAKTEKLAKSKLLIKQKVQSENIAKAIEILAENIKEGKTLNTVVTELSSQYNIKNIELLKESAIEFIKDNVFKDHISFYANHISELEFLYKAATKGSVKMNDEEMVCNINYSEAAKLLKQIEDARLTVYQIIQYQ